MTDFQWEVKTSQRSFLFPSAEAQDEQVQKEKEKEVIFASFPRGGGNERGKETRNFPMRPPHLRFV